MAGNTPTFVSKLAQQGIIQFHKQTNQMLQQSWNIREQMRNIDLAYIREQDWTDNNRRAKLANRYLDSDKIQNITVPVVMPQVEAATAYQASVFLTGLPIFESVAHPQYEDESLQLNSIIEDQSIRGGWSRELQLFFRDGFKYNLSAVEVAWDTSVVPALETDLLYDAKEGKPVEIAWAGNTIKRLDPYNLTYDTRCAMTDIPTKGEFASYTELLSRTALKSFINKLPLKMIDNLAAAYESGVVSSGAGISPETYYIPLINPDALINRNMKASTDWMAWAGLVNGNNPTIAYKNLYEVTTLYGRIIPSDFGLRVPAPNTPQVWKFIIVNNSVLIYAERQTNAHQMIPILFGQPNEDGLAYQTKSLATNAIPFQHVSSALMNQSLAASRKAIFDRMFYDPSRISPDAINNPNPASKVPCRPAAYGSNIRDAFAEVPFRDDQSGQVMQKISQLASLTDEATGRNRAQRGLFTKGNRTKEEYQDVMQNASGRDQLCSMLYEAQVFTPLKEMLKINILQYQGGTTLYSTSQQQSVKINPVQLRKAVLNFKMADGLTPASKEIDSDTLQVALQTMGASPQIAAGYNIGAAFSFLMKTQGADLKPFEKSPQQQAYEQASSQWQQTINNTVAAMSKAGQDPSNALKALPQPTPQQFGYTPGVIAQDSATPTQGSPSIMQQVVASMSGPTQQAPVTGQQPTTPNQQSQGN